MSGSVSVLADRAVDNVDGQPVWTFGEGGPIVDGLLAWERLGVGTRCETWLAWSVEMWSPVVVKLLRPHQVEHPRGRAAIAREADALGAVRHPAFPRLWADAREAPLPHLVMEFVDGPDLGEVFDETGAFDHDDLVQLGVQVGSALRALHASGLAHLDLKPDNIAVRDARLVVLDLGSARPLGRRQPQGRAAIGSAGYASPDLEGGAPIAAAMDVYGLGVVLAEAALDRRVFDPDLAASRRTPIAMPVRLDRRLRNLVLEMLSVDPAARPHLDSVLARLAALAPDAPEPLWPAAATARLSRETPG